MEIEDHFERIREVSVKITQTHEASSQQADLHNGLISHFHPDRLRADRQYVSAVGSLLIETVRLVPHIPEIFAHRQD